MSDCKEKCCACLASGVAVAGALLVVVSLVLILRHFTAPPPVNLARIEERKRALALLVADNGRVLQNYDWMDQAKGVVRVPVVRAMDLAVQYWQDPAAGRSNLIARVEKATAKPPVKPNEYE
jgi:hypothetical protein